MRSPVTVPVDNDHVARQSFPLAWPTHQPGLCENWRKMPDYRVQLENFTGPMDLLLYLVRRNELNIVQLPIARITVQFLEFLELLQLLDLDLIGDFVVMASALIEIKSRQVLPRTEEEAPEEIPINDDPCSELIQQLLEYKRYRDAAIALEHQAA